MECVLLLNRSLAKTSSHWGLLPYQVLHAELTSASDSGALMCLASYEQL